MPQTMVVGVPDRAKRQPPQRGVGSSRGGFSPKCRMCCAHDCAVLLCCRHMPLWILLWLSSISTSFTLAMAILQIATAAPKQAELLPTVYLSDQWF